MVQTATDRLEAVKPADSFAAALALPDENPAVSDACFALLAGRSDGLADSPRLFEDWEGSSFPEQDTPPPRTNDKLSDPVMAVRNALVDPLSNLSDDAKTRTHPAASPSDNALNRNPPNLAGAGQGPGGSSTPFAAGGGSSGGGGTGSGFNNNLSQLGNE